MSSNTSRLSKKVMRRVYLIYALRYLLQPFFVKLYILAAIFWQSAHYVSFGDVAHNARVSFPDIFHFGTEAFVRTEAVTLLYMGLAFLMLLFLSKDALGKFPIGKIVRNMYEHSRSLTQAFL